MEILELKQKVRTLQNTIDRKDTEIDNLKNDIKKLSYTIQKYDVILDKLGSIQRLVKE